MNFLLDVKQFYDEQLSEIWNWKTTACPDPIGNRNQNNSEQKTHFKRFLMDATPLSNLDQIETGRSSFQIIKIGLTSRKFHKKR